MSIENNSEFQQRTDSFRKVEFDKGIPLSMDYPNNSVYTLDRSILKIIKIVLNGIVKRPNNILLLFVYIIYIISFCLNSNISFSIEILYPIIPSTVFIIFEIIYEIIFYIVSIYKDSLTNLQKARVYDYIQKEFISVKWKDLKVGHIIKVIRDEIVPADIVVLETLNPNHICYVDESSINGIFDIFITKKACNDTRSPVMKQVNISDYIKNIKGQIKYDQPNIDMSKFDGRLKLESHPRSSLINIDNLVLRGSSLKNIKAIYGLVVYTGMDTKIMQVLKSNMKEIKVNKNEEKNFIYSSLRHVQISLIVFYIVMNIIYFINLIYKYRKTLYDITTTHEYVITYDSSSSMYSLIYSIFQFIISFQMIIPYTWYNYIYIAYYIVSIFIKYDINILNKPYNSTEIINKSCLADFGKVKYILSDKTGTLSSRKFKVKSLNFKGNMYFLDDQTDKNSYLFSNIDEDFQASQVYLDYKKSLLIKNEHNVNEDNIFQSKNIHIKINNMSILNENENFQNSFGNDIDPYYLSEDSLYSYNLNTFLEELAINHSVTSWKVYSPNELLNNETKFGSAFAEEKAIIKWLEQFNIYLKKSTERLIEIDINNTIQSYEILGRNKYTNNRKCSSIIYKRVYSSHDKYYLLCKSYDISNLSRIESERSSDTERSFKIKYQIEKMIEFGYRYVILLRRSISLDEVELFIDDFKSAQNNPIQSERLLEEVAYEYETELEIVGVIFYEESYNSDLKYCLNRLKHADVHIWIVSGDRTVNIESVAKNLNMYDCDVINILSLLENDHKDDLDNKISNQLMVILNKKSYSIEEASETQSINRKTTIFIHGKAFSIIYQDNRLYQLFALLLLYTENFFGSGFSPLDKYNLAKIMKKFICHKNKLLAIGDGLNDVMMLKEADLSIGIRSKEILQVRNTCDVIVSSFCQIGDLLLVHGSWNYNRIRKISFYSLYSSLLLGMPYFFKIYFSEVMIDYYIDYLFYMLVLIIVNSVIILLFSFDQHIDRSIYMISPYIYSDNFQKTSYLYVFFETIIKSIVDSYIVYYSYYMIGIHSSIMNIRGDIFDINEEWILYTITSILIIFSKLMWIQMSQINILNLCIFSMSFILIMVVGYINQSSYIAIYHILSSLTCVVSIFGIVSFTGIYEYCLFIYMNIYKKSLITNLLSYINSIMKSNKMVLDYEIIYESVVTNIKFLFDYKKNNEYNTFEDLIKILSEENIPVDSTIDYLSNLNNNKIVSSKIKFNLKFKNKKMEYDYSTYFLNQIQLSFFIFVLLKFLFWIGYFALFILFENISYTKILISLQVFYCFIGIIISTKYFQNSFYKLFIFYFYISIVIDLIMLFLNGDDIQMDIYLYFILNLTYPLLFGCRYIFQVLIGTLIYFIGISISIFTMFNFNTNPNLNMNKSNSSLSFNLSSSSHMNGPSQVNLYFLPISINELILIFTSILIMGIYGYNEELQSRINFIKFIKKRNDKKKDDGIFDNLVPKFIQEKMKTGDRGTTKEREVVTIIFANIAEFDDLVAKLKPRELISLLDKIYGTFDQLSNIHGIQKIETVGYTYMGAGGLKECEKDMDENTLIKHHAIRAFELALDMIEIMSGIVLGNGEKVKLKIGLHTGKVLAGVIGEHKPQFSLIGDTVNTAARMGAKVDKMCALLTEETYLIVKDEYSDFEEKVKQFKGKGDMKCYQANPMKNKKERQDAKMKAFRNFLTKFLQKAILEAEGTDLKFEDIFDQENKAQKQKIKRQNSLLSNQSNFIIEEDILKDHEDYYEQDAIYNIERDDEYKKKRRKTHIEKNLIPVSKSTETNFLFQNSFLLMNFNDDDYIHNESNIGNETITITNSNINTNSNQGIDKDNKDNSGGYSYNENKKPSKLYSNYKIQRQSSGISSSKKQNICFCIFLLFTFMNSIEYDKNTFLHTLHIFLRAIVIFYYMYINIYSEYYLKAKQTFFEYSIITSLVLLLIFQQMKKNLLPKEFLLESILEQNLIIIIIAFNCMIDYRKIFLTLLISIFILIINLSVNKSNIIFYFYDVLSMIISLSLLIFVILREYIGTFDYIKNQQVTEELLKAEKLLFNLMPPHVVISLKEDRTVADVINNVTILYTDIVNFTKFSAAQKDQSNIVRMLIELFKRMDNACIEYDVYKVHTIGDCFVVLSFTGKVPMNERDYVKEAQNVVKIGRKMIEIIRAVRETKEVNFPTLNMRIGIHTGKIIAGIIGSKIVRYDIFGSDCLVANMMESEGKEGRVNISEDTQKLLDSDEENKYTYTFNAKVDVPSIGKSYNSYLIDFAN